MVATVRPKPTWRRRLLRWSGCGCVAVLALLAAATGLLFVLLAITVPKSYPQVERPILRAAPTADVGGGLDGFRSPYIGHTGSWDGQGGGLFGASKLADMDIEVGMGLRWTFMCVYWAKMEPDGPVHLSGTTPPAWAALDAFVVAAQQRRLNILMQAPVVGGNAGGPPQWAGRREPGKSAPAKMAAAANFARKLAARYGPSGVLAQRQGWGTEYGVRAWELDNEPESYRTHWADQASDYAEFATKVAAAIKEVDPKALILTPAISGDPKWLESTLDAHALKGSPVLRERGVPYSIGPITDVVSFHNYEGLDTFFAGKDWTIERAFSQARQTFEKWENRAAGFEYPRKQEYWHTEGNYDFFGVMSRRRRAAWRLQFFARAFAAGIRKVVVMDASLPEQVAVRTFVTTLPDPFPMLPAGDKIEVLQGRATAFRHPDGNAADAGQVWVVWSLAGDRGAVVKIPVVRNDVEVVTLAGQQATRRAAEGFVQLDLQGDPKMPPPVLVVDRPAGRLKRGSGAYGL